MTKLFLGRARLRSAAPITALAALLVPENHHERAAASHRLVWSLFTDGPDRIRDFLWREEAPGRFMTLSARPPADPHGLFELEFKEFEPRLNAGDRLGFSLRANPIIARAEEKGQRGKRHDVVMDVLYALSKEDRAAHRMGAVVTAGQAWLARQGTAHGFEPLGPVSCDGYDQIRIPRAGKQPPAVFGVMDFAGALEVHDPDRFLAKIASGFGRARGYGYGLMLIRRLPS